MSVADTVADSSNQILRMVSDGWTWLRIGYTHPSKRLFSVFLFRFPLGLLRRVFCIRWKRSEIPIKSRFVGIVGLPSVLVVVDVKLEFFMFFLNRRVNTSGISTSNPKTCFYLVNVLLGCRFSLNAASA